MKIRKCCGKYTLKEKCSCGSETKSPHPARFSPNDKWVKYRLMAKGGKDASLE